MKRIKIQFNRRIEFSKKILYVVSFVSITVTVFTMAVVWRTGDTSALAYLIPAVAAETATATGFYYSKAKVENEIKLKSAYGIKIKREDIGNGNNDADI